MYTYRYKPNQSVRDCPTVPAILFADECKLLQQYFRRRFQLTVTSLCLYIGAPSRAPVVSKLAEKASMDQEAWFPYPVTR